MEQLNSHECKKKIGKIIDITVREKRIYCRGCGAELLESQIMPSELSILRKENNYKNNQLKRKKITLNLSSKGTQLNMELTR